MDVQVAGLLVSCVALLVSLAAAGFSASQAKWTRHAVTRNFEASLVFGMAGRGGVTYMDGAVMDVNSVRRNMEQGFEKAVFGVFVKNVGALPVTVTRWTIKQDGGASYTPMGDSIGPTLPFTVQPGSGESWFVDAVRINHAIDTVNEVLKLGEKPTIKAVIECGDGATKTTNELVIR